MNINFDINTIALIILTLIVLGLVYYIYHLNNKLNKFLIGSSSTNLDESITSINTNLEDFKKFRAEIEAYLTTVEKRLKKSVQAVYTVRFNPFKGTGSGSNQSFSTAFLNEEKDGVVISSLYSREHISIYSKPIKGGISEYEFSDEEKESLENAKNLLK